jgi:hypothetical protein
MKLELTPQEFLKLYNVLKYYVKSQYGNDGDELICDIVNSLEKHMLKTLKTYERLSPMSDCEFIEWEERQFEKIEQLREQERKKGKDYVCYNGSIET